MAFPSSLRRKRKYINYLCYASAFGGLSNSLYVRIDLLSALRYQNCETLSEPLHLLSDRLQRGTSFSQAFLKVSIYFSVNFLWKPSSNQRVAPIFPVGDQCLPISLDSRVKDSHYSTLVDRDSSWLMQGNNSIIHSVVSVKQVNSQD